MGQPAARVGDLHVCPMITPSVPPVPHVGGPILPIGVPTVLIGSMPAAVMGTMCLCVGPPDMIVKGSMGVLVSGRPAARMGDNTLHGGIITIGFPTVMIGEMGIGAPGDFAITVVPPSLWDMLMNNPATIKYGTIEIKPDPNDPSFQGKVLGDLMTINSTPSGHQLLQSLNDSGKKVTIQHTTDGNSCSYAASASQNADGTPGTPSDATVNYNPDRQSLGSQPWQTRPPAIGLAHELIHADHATHGTSYTGTSANDSKPNPANPGTPPQEDNEELNTAGIPPHNNNGGVTENKIRTEWPTPQPQRGWY